MSETSTIETARILSEALPFLQRYDDQVVVVKYGGHAMVDAELARKFARDMVMAAVVGAGPVADAFFVAFRLPNLFRSLFAEGAFTASFLPLFSATLTREGREPARAHSLQSAEGDEGRRRSPFGLRSISRAGEARTGLRL